MVEDLNSFSKNIKGKIKFDYSLKNHTWLNIGGNAKIFFVPETLTELKDFLLYIKKENNNFFTIGAGSNLLISENVNNHIFIKIRDKSTIIASNFKYKIWFKFFFNFI